MADPTPTFTGQRPPVRNNRRPQYPRPRQEHANNHSSAATTDREQNGQNRPRKRGPGHIQSGRDPSLVLRPASVAPSRTQQQSSPAAESQYTPLEGQQTSRGRGRGRGRGGTRRGNAGRAGINQGNPRQFTSSGALQGRQFGGHLTAEDTVFTAQQAQSTELQGGAAEFVPDQTHVQRPRAPPSHERQQQRRYSKSMAPDLTGRIHEDIEHGMISDCGDVRAAISREIHFPKPTIVGARKSGNHTRLPDSLHIRVGRAVVKSGYCRRNVPILVISFATRVLVHHATTWAQLKVATAGRILQREDASIPITIRPGAARNTPANESVTKVFVEPAKSHLMHIVIAVKSKNLSIAVIEARTKTASAHTAMKITTGPLRNGLGNLSVRMHAIVHLIVVNTAAKSPAIRKPPRSSTVHDHPMCLVKHARIPFRAVLSSVVGNYLAATRVSSHVTPEIVRHASSGSPLPVAAGGLRRRQCVIKAPLSNLSACEFATSVIKDLAVPAKKPSFTRFLARANVPYCNHLYLVGPNLHHADTNVKGRRVVVILRHSNINNAGSPLFVVARSAERNLNAVLILAGRPATLLENAKTPIQNQRPVNKNVTQKVEARCNASKHDPEGNGKKELKCDDECARLERNRKLALALNIDQNTHTDDHIPYSEETLKLYQELGPQWAQQQEREFRVFAGADDEKRLRSKPMPNLQRRFIHVLAEDFGIDSESMDPEPHRHVFLYKTPRFVSAPSKTIGECVRIRTKQRSVGGLVASVKGEASTKDKRSNVLGDPYNGFLLTNPRFGLTIEELRTTVESVIPSGFMPTLDISFLPSGEVVLKTRPNGVPQGRNIATERESEGVFKNAKPAIARVVSSNGMGSVELCRTDGSLNVTRRESEEAGAEEMKGWSQVAAKGAPRREVKSTASIQGRNGFEVLGQSNMVVLGKKKKEKQKKEVIEVVDDWEKAMSEEEERENGESKIANEVDMTSIQGQREAEQEAEQEATNNA
ncbi:MAG: hypothetical protein Q9157_007270 [Trypethelium eluteriae]